MNKTSETLDEITIHTESPGNVRATIQISGAGAGDLTPDKVLQLMDLLDLPKGTKATLVTKASNVIVR